MKTLTRPIITSSLNATTERLLAGEVVGMPTETVYGLAARIHQKTALQKIFALKHRPFFDPLIVHVASLAEAANLSTGWSALHQRLAETFWPGPLTLVVPKSERIDPLITSGLSTVALRWPAHALAQQLIQVCGPLAAPSANQFGRSSPTTAAHVAGEFPEDGIVILDGGPCDFGVESTVVSVRNTPSDTPVIEILRPGAVTAEDLQKVGDRFAATVVQAASAASPGHLRHHYMPSIPLIIVPPEWEASEATAKELKLSADARLAARELYEKMRELSALGAGSIYVRRHARHCGGLWTAIWDRLQRAASADLSLPTGQEQTHPTAHP